MALTELNFSQAHRLGPRALYLFLVRDAKWSTAALLVFGAVWLLWRTIIQEFYPPYGGLALRILSILILAWFLITVLKAYLEYRGYSYRFENEFFQITKGYFARQEIGVVYHQIQTVTLRHGVTDRMMGVSHLVIVMNSVQPTEVILPALGRAKARLVQQELLRQARLRAANIAQGVQVVES